MSTNKPVLHERHVTVSRNCIPSGSSYVEVPAIRVAGRYLEKRGFTIGSKVTIEEYENMIIIKLDKKCTDYQGPYPYSTLNQKMNVIRKFSEEAIRNNITYDEELINRYFVGDLARDIKSLIYNFSKGRIPKRFHPHVTQLLGEVLKEKMDEAVVNDLLSRLKEYGPEEDTAQSDLKNEDVPIPDQTVHPNLTTNPNSDIQPAELKENQITQSFDQPKRA